MKKKVISVLLCTVLASALLLGCGGNGGGGDADTGADTTVEDDAGAENDADDAAGPLAGKRVAVVRNLVAGDHTQQYLAGTVEEGERFGMTVDTFVTDGDDARMKETVAQMISQGYDALIISHAQLSYAYDMLLPAREAGIEIVTFDSMPMRGGDPEGELLEGVTSTAQDDFALAELSLGHMIDEHLERGGELPVRVLKTFMGPGIPPLDRRDIVYRRLEDEGYIYTVNTVSPADFSNVRGDSTMMTAAMLPTFGPGEIDAVWGSFDEMAKGVLDAFLEAGREDIPIYYIDISNDNIQLMLRNPEIFRSSASVDPRLIGIVNMRLVAMKLMGYDTPDFFDLAANNILVEDLTEDTTMENLVDIIPGWGDPNDPVGALFTDTIRSWYVK
ncbi:MAG: substrate-binding domain-containing protein [Lachnospiraceae bacterium]|nr:substrate-binding domain-containing protein [Lachnospiraceae bacterium]